MAFQNSVNRNYTTGFPGAVVRHGPTIAQSARIASDTLGTDPGASTNRISRAFGYSGEQGSFGGKNSTVSVYPAIVPDVIVGGPVFFGILGNTKHYASYGTADGALTPTMDLAKGLNAEFFSMVPGLIVELYNETTAAKTVSYGDTLAYVSSAITAAQNTLALPYGAIISVAAGGTVPDGFVAIPGSKVITPQSLAASAAGKLILGDATVELTE